MESVISMPDIAMTPNAKILEIFSSIQGEGKYAGIRQVFVRFFECNMHCAWCDTPASIGDTSRNYRELSLDEVSRDIAKLWKDSHSVSLTGGEPLLQKDFIKDLLPFMKEQFMPVYLETNGILFQELEEVIDDVDIIAMDIKMPSSTKQKSYWEEHESFLKLALKKDVFLKAVVTSDTAREDVVQTVNLVASVDPDVLLILQPNTYELKNGVVAKCLEYQEYCLKHLSNVRIVPQMHKFMKLR